MIKGVIFDMDGLMFDTEYLAYQTNFMAAKEFGYELDEEVVKNLIGMNVENSTAYMKSVYGKDFPYEDIYKRAREMRYVYYEKNPMTIKDGLMELLDYLKKHRIKMAVASSTRRDRVQENLKSTHTYEYFDYIVGGDQEPKGKPEPDIFLNALQGLHLNSEECLVLEDSKNGILAAHNAHIKVICIPDLVRHNQEILDYTWYTLPSLKDVIGVIDEANS